MARHNFWSNNLAVASATPVSIVGSIQYANSQAFPQGFRGDAEIRILNLSTNNVFVGLNGVTTSNGYVIRPAANNVPETILECTANLYLIVASGTSNVSVAVIW